MVRRYRLYEIDEGEKGLSFEEVWDDPSGPTCPPPHIPENAKLLLALEAEEADIKRVSRSMAANIITCRMHARLLRRK